MSTQPLTRDWETPDQLDASILRLAGEIESMGVRAASRGRGRMTKYQRQKLASSLRVLDRRVHRALEALAQPAFTPPYNSRPPTTSTRT